MTSVEPAAVIDVPGASGTIAVVTDGTTVWAAGDGAIVRIDAATNRVERLPAPTQSDDTTMAIADDGLWVTRWAGGHLYRLDPQTGKVLLSVDVPTPVKIAFVGDDLWVGLENAHKMTLVDRKTGVLGRSVDAGAYGTAGLGDLWFASDHSTTIERVDPASGSVKATIEGKGEDNCMHHGRVSRQRLVELFWPRRPLALRYPDRSRDEHGGDGRDRAPKSRGVRGDHRRRTLVRRLVR